ncbi:NADH:flavin oxidoreductase [Pseudoalteromonas sp. MSK9-3]|uniref:oxidoreductase n=1 Tax=Pseudoalteromonas sp. MSK9-3 TaxID=1897633 RepID=UPI000E6D2C14|nr:NADH:flavin oxidoreductase [Pseudoalteromonas sp. MSK9-3]RJE77175.1 NADH:flavin oxidoreductase [Pseudoalteromonas sp. MSK9-3]
MSRVMYSAATKSLDFTAKLKAKNRLYFAPMGFDLCDNQGKPLPSFFELYQSLILGGCGFGFMGNASVDSGSKYNGAGLKLTTQAHADALKPIFEFANKHNFLLGAQLQHYGPQGAPSDDNPTLLSPSGIASSATLKKFPYAQTVAMDEAQIYACVEQFKRSAILAKKAGAKLLQLQASNGYLISSFLSPRTNQRKDEWGGSALARVKFLLTIIREIKTAVGDEVALTIRLGVDDGFGEQGQQAHLLGEVAAAIEEAGASSIACSVGVSETFKQCFSHPQEILQLTRDASRHLKRYTRLPVGFTGSVDSLDTAEAIIDSGDADFVGFARAVLADNALIKKELSGKHDLVHRCQWDALCFRDKREPRAERVYCCVNPAYRRPAQLQQYYKEN